MVLPSVEPEVTVTDQRDAKILLLEAALLSLQRGGEDKAQLTAGAASMQHQPPAPMYSSNHNPHHGVVVKPESFVLPHHGANLQISDQSSSRLPLTSSANNEPDAFCSFIFRMQQHANEARENSIQQANIFRENSLQRSVE